MSRVRFPLIVEYRVGGLPPTYAKEDFDEHGFGQTRSIFEATIYNSSKEFSKFYGHCATKFKRLNGDGVKLIHMPD